MNKKLVATLNLIAFLVIAGVVVALVTQPQSAASIQAKSLTPTPSVVPLVGEVSSIDTAIPVYVSNTYKTDGMLPLNTWQSITVYGETFPAYVVSHEGGQTILTVNPTAVEACGALSVSPLGEN